MYLNYLAQKRRKELGLLMADSRFDKAAILIRWKRTPTQPTIPVITKPTPVPTKTTTPSAPSAPPIEHLINDPLTPSLVTYMSVPPSLPTTNPITVKNYKGGGFGRGTVEYQAADAYVTVAETLNYINGNGSKIPHWRRTSSLTVYPRAGVDLNAYYDGQNLKFFYYSAPQIGGAIYTVDSADIVSHECGHSILDSYRPDLWSAPYAEVGAFHECFGDFCALMHALTYDEMINQAFLQTNGDLSKSNVISRLAEQFGAAIYRLDPNGRNSDCLRNAVNTFKYADPGTLPDDSPDNQLSSEVHNFSRVFTGAIYDVFVAIFKFIKGTGVIAIEAVKQARDTTRNYVIKAIINAPLTSSFYASVANTMLWADSQINAGKYHTIMRQVFIDRNILTSQVGMLSATKSPNSENIVKTKYTTTLKLADVMVGALSDTSDPLMRVELELPCDDADLFDCNGRHRETITDSEEDVIQAATEFVFHLQNTNSIGPDDSTPWEVRNGKLLRTRTCCQHRV